MPNILSPVLRPFGLDPSQGFDTASSGVREAQQQANALSDLQWNRQMQGLGQATGYVDQLQGLYNSMYSPGGGAMAAGGSGPKAQQMGAGAMATLQPPAAPTQAPGKTGQASKLQALNLGFLENKQGRDTAMDFVPGLGQANRVANFAKDPSWGNAGRVAGSVIPGANLAYDLGKNTLGKLF